MQFQADIADAEGDEKSEEGAAGVYQYIAQLHGAARYEILVYLVADGVKHAEKPCEKTAQFQLFGAGER